MVKQLPNRYMFTEKEFVIYVLDDWSVHLVRKFLFKKEYIVVIIGDGITGDGQTQAAGGHHHLKSHYRDFEMKKMHEQLKKDPNKITFPSLNELMHMLLQKWKLL